MLLHCHLYAFNIKQVGRENRWDFTEHRVAMSQNPVFAQALKITQAKCAFLSFNCLKFILNFATNTCRRTEDKNTFKLGSLILTYSAEFECKYIQSQRGSVQKLRCRRWSVLLKGALGGQLCLSLNHWQNYPLSYRVPVRERYGSTLLPATREQHDQNCTQSH